MKNNQNPFSHAPRMAAPGRGNAGTSQKHPFAYRTVGLLCLLFLATVSELHAQLSYTTHWVGNTFGGGANWIQNKADEIDVADDGTLFVGSDWDEAGRCVGIYKDGKVVAQVKQYDGAGGHKCWGWGTATFAIAADNNYLYVNNCDGDILRFDRLNGYKYVDKVFTGVAVGLTFGSTNLYLVKGNGDVEVRDVSSLGTIKSSFNITGAKDVAVDDAGAVWVLDATSLRKYNSSGAYQNVQINITSPNSVNFDKVNKHLLITDHSTSQVLFYNTSGTFVKRFGESGGIGAGTPGMVTPTKFWRLSGAGTDNAGNIYVGMDDDGTGFRKFTSTGALSWELLGLHFVDCVDVDPASDGKDIYGKNEHMAFDFSKPAGQSWSLKSITYDRIKYPTEPRGKNDKHALTNTFLRRVNGKLLKFVTGMYAGTLHVYRFDGEIARHCQTFTDLGWALMPDKDGNLWYGDQTMYKIPLTGFTTEGCPVYGSPQTVTSRPSPFDRVERFEYNQAADVMYISGYTPQLPATDWGLIGSVLARYPNWSQGNRQASHSFELPKDESNLYPKSMAQCEEYVFVVGSRGAVVHVYKASDFTKLGTITPGPEVNNETGWVDIAYAIRAFKRSNGEYMILVEEDAKGKVLVYRWCPSGSCPESGSTSSIKIEAENYTAKNGTGTKSGDGGTIVAWIDPGNWLDYSVNVPAAASYKLEYRYASPNTNVQIQLRNSSGTILNTFSPPSTGSWSTFGTASTTVSLPAGTQTLRVYSNGGGFDFNWWQLTPEIAPLQMEAENYTAKNGTGTKSGDGGTIVAWIDPGNWLDYSVNVPAAASYKLEYRYASPNTNVQIQLRNSSGTILNTFSPPSTGSWSTFGTASTTVSLPAGTQTLRVYSNGGGFDFNWWRLTYQSSARIAAEESGSSSVLSVYPVPVAAGQDFTLAYDAERGGLTHIAVTDILGRTQVKMIRESLSGRNEVRLSAGTLSKGLYLLNVTVGNRQQSRKVLITD